jgi:Tol biopolymer transport system component
MKRTMLFAGVAALALAAAAPVVYTALAAQETKIIPRKDIFGNPTRTAPQLSPDGKHIAYIAPQNGVLNVWVAPSSNVDAAKVITNDTKRGIRNYFWAKNSTHILYTQDTGGD